MRDTARWHRIRSSLCPVHANVWPWDDPEWLDTVADCITRNLEVMTKASAASTSGASAADAKGGQIT